METIEIETETPTRAERAAVARAGSALAVAIMHLEAAFCRRATGPRSDTLDALRAIRAGLHVAERAERWP